jgi:hypothetical protein
MHCFCNDAKIQAREGSSDISSMHTTILLTRGEIAEESDGAFA